MYVDRDTKIIVIYRSIIGIVVFSSFALAVMYGQQKYPDKNFTNLLLLIFGIIAILTLILITSIVYLKLEITKQSEYLQSIPQQSSTGKEQIAKIPYDRSGLYFLIGVTVLLIILTLYIYTAIVFNKPTDVYVPLSAVTIVSLAFLVILIILFITLFVSLNILLKRIHTPSYTEAKACPRCGSTDIFQNDYSWWGGFIGPRLVHQVRCKKCGKAYNGATGTDITRQVGMYTIVGLIILCILLIVGTFV